VFVLYLAYFLDGFNHYTEKQNVTQIINQQEKTKILSLTIMAILATIQMVDLHRRSSNSKKDDIVSRQRKNDAHFPTLTAPQYHTMIQKCRRRVVTFDDTVKVRTYETILGDNPSTTKGPPVSIGWNYTTNEDSLAATESDRSSSEKDLYLDSKVRIDRLLEFGVTKTEMMKAIEEVRKIQNEHIFNVATTLPCGRVTTSRQQQDKQRVVVAKSTPTASSWLGYF